MSASAEPTPNVEPRDALDRLRAGNLRFASGASRTLAHTAQQPFAIVLGCSDARVPAEIVFDQGLGDLFVIRVAGNVVAPSQIGSVEFAVERFGTQLVVVLGHSDCGAVIATIEELRGVDRTGSRNLRSIVDRVRPAVAPLLGNEHPDDELLARAVAANILASVDHLRRGSDVIERAIDSGRLRIVGAEYSISSGLVEFFDAPS